MDQLTLIERFRENEELARKFHEVESSILSVLNFRDFFEHLLLDIGEIFAIPQVWFSLLDDVDLSRLIRHSATSKLLRERIKVVDRETFAQLLPDTERPLLVNEGLHRYLRLLPASGLQALGSLALVPVTLDGEVVGSLNLADRSVSRYAPGLNTVLVERLALKVSLCLSNVTAHEKLQKVAHYDPLTELLNRRAMESILQREFDRARRYARPLSLVFIDLDDFKRVNDTYGHDCGDLLLKHLAAGLSRLCRASDVVTRFAGDEFVLILPETGRERAEKLMVRILGDLARHPLLVDREPIRITASYGIASSENDAIGDTAALLKVADQQLYASKEARKQEDLDV
ncbi:GGDEF domain-containing protein [Trichloromonas sp.]|uniref:GGDEF domain-containing protein n=1 Tax=Trichloromonas sp. TaxID=3069249 RepID=UPI002A45756F|nr:GGDEF domain-containing protein [Trichloromonas sp.]